jgi:hypothetical protein
MIYLAGEKVEVNCSKGRISSINPIYILKSSLAP